MSLDNFIWYPVKAPKYAVVRTPLHFDCPAENNMTVTVELPVGCPVQYWIDEKNRDSIKAILDYISVEMPKEEFDRSFHKLPPPPPGLRYCSWDEVFLDELDELWIYDFRTNTFVQTKALMEQSEAFQKVSFMLEENFNEDNYGEDWVALIEDT
ncbi:hypothetical protein [uncultured Dysosmobacter sp.]|uniref:hypothetical protein n=1 Tax=uncultured Dysosmobacter sp. TaxID=2591384 RepID=UPI002631037E|nr:hypothetical protein [uncultured Dysosmobacter sp.]